jgi:hypothetical protein
MMSRGASTFASSIFTYSLQGWLYLYCTVSVSLLYSFCMGFTVRTAHPFSVKAFLYGTSFGKGEHFLTTECRKTARREMVSTSGGNHLEGHGEGDSSRAEDAILGLMTSLTFPRHVNECPGLGPAAAGLRPHTNLPALVDKRLFRSRNRTWPESSHCAAVGRCSLRVAFSGGATSRSSTGRAALGDLGVETEVLAADCSLGRTGETWGDGGGDAAASSPSTCSVTSSDMTPLFGFEEPTGTGS